MCTHALSSTMIDIYTQKTFSGKGPNMPCDAFSPQEKVTLYAYASSNGDPIGNKLVSFEIHGPHNPYNNITFFRAALTDENGVAAISFRTPWPCEQAEEIIFGNWTAYARVEVAEMVATDMMQFLVGRLVEITSVETGTMQNSDWMPKDLFKKGECIGIKLTVKSIAFTDKTAAFTTVGYDCLGVPVAYWKVFSYTVHPGEKDIIMYCYLFIPKWAFIGIGTIYANAYNTDLKAPYCPETTCTFTVMKD